MAEGTDNVTRTITLVAFVLAVLALVWAGFNTRQTGDVATNVIGIQQMQVNQQKDLDARVQKLEALNARVAALESKVQALETSAPAPPADATADAGKADGKGKKGK